jgi:hypothetical protein
MRENKVAGVACSKRKKHVKSLPLPEREDEERKSRYARTSAQGPTKDILSLDKH